MYISLQEVQELREKDTQQVHNIPKHVIRPSKPFDLKNQAILVACSSLIVAWMIKQFCITFLVNNIIISQQLHFARPICTDTETNTAEMHQLNPWKRHQQLLWQSRTQQPFTETRVLLLPGPLLSQKNPVHILAPCFLMISFNIILLHIPRSSKTSLPFRFHSKVLWAFLFTHMNATYTSSSLSHPS